MFSLFLAGLLTVTLPAPVAVSHCDFVQSGSFTRGLHVVFTNTSARPIRHVEFEVRHGDRRGQIVDKGYFAHGVTIDHVLVPKELQLYHGLEPQGCTVTRVQYADGSVWSSRPF